MNHPFDTSANPSATQEDAFFVLRDVRTLFLRRLVEIVRRAGISSQAVIEAFTEALGDAHDELASARQRDGFEVTDGLTASRITLMCDADLELDIRIGNLSRHLVDIGGNALWRVQLRYMTLLQRSEMAPEANPVGPEAIATGLWAICRSNNADAERNLDLLDRLESVFSSELPAVYGELNDLLASRNIEPAQTQITSSGGNRAGTSAGSSSSASPQANSTGDPLSALQNMLNAQFGGAIAPAGPAAGNGNVALSAATLVMLNQLTTRLEQLQLGSIGAPGEASAATDTTGAPRALKAADLDLPLGNPESVALETLGYIFEAIFNTWELPDTVKTAISRLQIPLLKLSIYDPSLFSDDKHPARRLINAMGRLAVGLPRNAPRSHPVSTQLWQIAGTVSETLEGDPAVLAAPLAELDTLIAQRDAAVQAAAKPFIALLADTETQEKSGDAARRWLEEIEQQGSAQEILDFARTYWVRVMAAAAPGGDHDGGQWQEAKATMTDLMWSVEPKPGADERKRLATLVPTLIKRINAGLDSIAVPTQERAPFLDACFNLQTASLRGNPPPVTKGQAPAPQTRDAVETPGITTKVIKAAEIAIRYLCRGEHSATYRSPMSGAKAGRWLQFSLGDGESACGLIAWVSPQSGAALLYNPDWTDAVALSAEVLDKQFRAGEARDVSARAIFDTAAEQALNQLAKGRQPG